MLRVVLCLVSLALANGSFVLGQTPTVIDGTFDPGTGADNDVFALVRQPDGRIVVGGQFISFNGAGRARIARLNENGSLDGTFAPGTRPLRFYRALQADP